MKRSGTSMTGGHHCYPRKDHPELGNIPCSIETFDWCRRYGEAGVKGMGGAGAGGFSNPFDIFEQIFGAGVSTILSAAVTTAVSVTDRETLNFSGSNYQLLDGTIC